MARLLTYLSASSGNTFPAIDTLLELQRRGHEVHVRSRASDVGGYAALGLCAAAIDPDVEQIEFDDWRGRSQVDSFMRMVRAYRDGDELCLELADTGIGISPGVNIFELFTTTKSHGTGLGLAVVRQIISAHGGRVDYRSEPGNGTIFTVRLPLSKYEITN